MLVRKFFGNTTSFQCLYLQLWTNFTHSFGVSIVGFEQVSLGRDCSTKSFKFNLKHCDLCLRISICEELHLGLDIAKFCHLTTKNYIDFLMVARSYKRSGDYVNITTRHPKHGQTWRVRVLYTYWKFGFDALDKVLVSVFILDIRNISTLCAVSLF